MFVIKLMNGFLDKCQPADLIAVVTIACGTLLMLNGKDGTVGVILATITTFYFGGRFFKASKTDGKIE